MTTADMRALMEPFSGCVTLSGEGDFDNPGALTTLAAIAAKALIWAGQPENFPAFRRWMLQQSPDEFRDFLAAIQPADLGVYSMAFALGWEKMVRDGQDADARSD